MNAFLLCINVKSQIVRQRKFRTTLNPILRYPVSKYWTVNHQFVSSSSPTLTPGAPFQTEVSKCASLPCIFRSILAKSRGFLVLGRSFLSFSHSQGFCIPEKRSYLVKVFRSPHESVGFGDSSLSILFGSSIPFYLLQGSNFKPFFLDVCILPYYRSYFTLGLNLIDEKTSKPPLMTADSQQNMETPSDGKRKRDEDGSQRGRAREKVVDLSEYVILKEGEAEILMHGNDVFYNKTQVVNRDLSIAILRAFVSIREKEYSSKPKKNQNKKEGGPVSAEPVDLSAAVSRSLDSEVSPGAVTLMQVEVDVQESREASSSASDQPKPLRILEALAASGLRALRYAREIQDVASVVAVDNDPVAVEACVRNVKLNGTLAVSKVLVEHADARIYMLTHEKEFDVVDLDPYGSPSVFLDSAVQSVADGGILMCTATDMAVLCGNNGEVCYSKYGAYSLRAKYCHEMALRILLASIESHANRYKRHIVPLVSVSVDFYVRVFVRVYTSAVAMKETPSKLSYVYQCVGCDCFHYQSIGRIIQKSNSTRYMPGVGPAILPNCKQCGKLFNMGGPIWSAPIHDHNWVNLTLELMTKFKTRYPAYEKIHSLLTAVSEELFDVPLFISLHSISATLKCTPPSSVLFRSAVVNAGFRISGSHANPLALKTDAPMEVIWDIMRCWVKLHPVKAQAVETAGSVILSKAPELKANFSRTRGAQSYAQSKGVPRFLPNPEEYWGPKPRAGRRILEKHAPLVGAALANGKFCHVETLKSSNDKDEIDEP